YLLARAYLDRQADERLAAAVATLVAAVEFKPGGLEWEGRERRLPSGGDAADGPVRWAVHDGRGQLVDCSWDRGPGPPARAPAPGGNIIPDDGQPWRL